MCFFPFFSLIKYFTYNLWYISNIASIILFYNITITSSSISKVRNDTGASIIATSNFSVASSVLVISTNSVSAIGEVTSEFSDPFLLNICNDATFYISASFLLLKHQHLQHYPFLDLDESFALDRMEYHLLMHLLHF